MKSLLFKVGNKYPNQITLLVLALLLVPTLFLPLGADQCIFIRGGELLFSGGKLYHEYFDQKPPTIFILYGLAGVLFGKNDISYRVFDFIWQMFTAFSLLYSIQRLTNNKTTSIIAAVVYCLLYSSMGHSTTLQCESFAAPAFVWLIYLSVYKNSTSPKILLIRGMLIGFCFGLKFTLGAVLVCMFIWELFNYKSISNSITTFILLLVGFLFGSAISLYPFFDPDVWKGYVQVFEYTRYYISVPPINLEFVRNSLVEIGHFFGDNLSLSITGSAVAGFFVGFYKYGNSNSNNTSKTIQLTLLLLIVLCFTIIIERKYIPYYFLRIFVPISLLVSIGIVPIVTSIKARWFSMNSLWRCIIITLSILMFMFSPLPRLMKNIKISALYITSKNAFEAEFQKSDNAGFAALDVKSIVGTIKNSGKKGRTFVLSSDASYLYRELDERPFPRYTTAVYYYAIITPRGAHEDLLQNLKDSHWIVIQSNDNRPGFYGHDKSSWESVKSDSAAFHYISNNFNQIAVSGALILFERNK